MFINKWRAWPYYNCLLDFLYAKYLKFFSRKKCITNDTLVEIKRIEQLAYPKQMRAYAEINSVKEFADYLECYDSVQIDCFLKEDFYLICILHYNCVELFDLASEKQKCRDIFTVEKYIADHYLKKDLYANSRETTSYPLYKLCEKRGKIKIIEDEEEDFMGEKFHNLRMRAKS